MKCTKDKSGSREGVTYKGWERMGRRDLGQSDTSLGASYIALTLGDGNVAHTVKSGRVGRGGST